MGQRWIGGIFSINRGEVWNAVILTAWMPTACWRSMHALLARLLSLFMGEKSPR